MEHEQIEDQMTNEHYISIKTDVQNILNLLEGNKRFSQKGLVERVNDNEAQIRLLKIEFNNFKTKVTAYATVGAAAGAAFIQIITSLIF